MNLKQTELLSLAEQAPSEQECPVCDKQLTIMPLGVKMQDADEEPAVVQAVIADPKAKGDSYTIFQFAKDARTTFAAHLKEHEPKPELPLAPGRIKHLDLDRMHDESKFQHKESKGWTRLNIRQPLIITHQGKLVDVNGDAVKGTSPYTVEPGLYYAEGFEDDLGNRIGDLTPVDYTPDGV